MARHNMCMRLKSGREFRFSCEEYTIRKNSMTQELAGVEFKNTSGECPKFFKTDDIESISEYIEGEERVGNMTPKEFRDRMEELSHLDTERRHIEMDDCMCKLLTELGYGEGVEIFNSVALWYA